MTDEKDSEKLAELQERYQILNDLLQNNKLHISGDTLLVVGANLFGILLILSKERLDIITTKAIGFVMRARV